MSNPVEGLFKVYEDMVEVWLVLEIFLTEDSYVENLLCAESVALCKLHSLSFASPMLNRPSVPAQC